MSSPLLSIEDLGVTLELDGSAREVLRSVHLEVGTGEAVGLVGESGSGKSMTIRALTRLLPPGAQVSGAIRFEGRDVRQFGRRELRDFRARDIGMVFQDPRAHVNPVRSIEDHLVEGIRGRRDVSRSEARRRAIELLEQVRVDRADQRLRQYPHELSGGLLQRVVIAGALASDPKLLLADEPTTALDATTQADVLALLNELRRERGLSLVFITHDLEIAAAICTRTCVMYAGSIVEVRSSAALHDDPLHPYTAGLAGARPRIDRRLDRLDAIPGAPAAAYEVPDGCAFEPRCRHSTDACRASFPDLEPLDGGWVRCRRADELRAVLTSTKGAAHA